MTSMRDAGHRALARPRQGGLAAVAAVAVLAASGYAAATSLQTPAARPAGAAATEFSATRAAQHVRTVAARPHVAGSAANDAVREYLVAALRGSGLAPAVQEAGSVQ